MKVSIKLFPANFLSVRVYNECIALFSICTHKFRKRF